MAHQKVITVNIDMAGYKQKENHKEIELELVNKYLDEGYKVDECFTEISNNSTYMNITFILKKD